MGGHTLSVGGFWTPWTRDIYLPWTIEFTKWTKPTWQTKSDHESHQIPYNKKNHMKHHNLGQGVPKLCRFFRHQGPVKEEDLVTVRNFLSASERAAAIEAAQDGRWESRWRRWGDSRGNTWDVLVGLAEPIPIGSMVLVYMLTFGVYWW